MNKSNDLINDILLKNCITFNSSHSHEHTFVFDCATRNEIVFKCPICNSISYLYYEDHPSIYQDIINVSLLNNDFISRAEVRRNYISKKGVKMVAYHEEDEEDEED